VNQNHSAELFVVDEENHDMEDQDRLSYALEHVAGKSVFIVDRVDWARIVDESGEPIKLAEVPTPLSGLTSMSAHVMTAGSGIYNASPGIDVVRFDPADEPCVYNIDHYTVLEHFVSSPLYPEALRVARVQVSNELADFIQSHVFVVGPYRLDNHHVEEIPENIRKAKRKNTSA
jgi:hypothetical protein